MWLSDFTLILPDRIIEHGSVQITDGIITEIREGIAPGGVMGHGAHLMPGFIDMHGDMIEIELEPRPNVPFPMEIALPHLDARLAACGITTAYAAVSFSAGARSGGRRSFEHTSQIIRDLDALRGTCRVDHKIHARFDITFDNAVQVLADLIDDGKVDLVSLMDHTPGQGQYRNLETHIKNKAAYHGVSEIEARQMVATKIAERTRPQDELMANIQAVARMCADHGIALASHDDDTVEKANLMADLGVVIAEFPVTIEAARTGIKRGMMTAMGAPNALRGQSYSGNLSALDAHAAGLLSILAADYHPASILPAVHVLAQTDPNGLPGAVCMASLNPATALGLTDRGEIAIGKRADLMASRDGRILRTWSKGDIIHDNGVLSGHGA